MKTLLHDEMAFEFLEHISFSQGRKSEDEDNKQYSNLFLSHMPNSISILKSFSINRKFLQRTIPDCHSKLKGTFLFIFS